MGERGPIPKRSSERRRRNKDSQPETVDLAGTGLEGPVKPPKASGHWHPIAKAWFKSLGESGQSLYYEPSDWQAARYVAEVMSRQLKAKRPGAQLFSSVWSAMTDLLTTEAARRRVRMEIERPDEGEEEQPAGVTELDDYRRELSS
jgi:hypothetical protein